MIRLVTIVTRRKYSTQKTKIEPDTQGGRLKSRRKIQNEYSSRALCATHRPRSSTISTALRALAQQRGRVMETLSKETIDAILANPKFRSFIAAAEIVVIARREGASLRSLAKILGESKSQLHRNLSLYEQIGSASLSQMGQASNQETPCDALDHLLALSQMGQPPGGL
jgi:hypothetical protein